MNTNKEENRKSYKFQDLDLKLKQRNLEIRKITNQLYFDFIDYITKNYELTEVGISNATMTYFSDEHKLKELFSKTLDGNVDKINYDAEDDKKYLELIDFAGTVFSDFFSYTLLLQKKILKKSKN